MRFATIRLSALFTALFLLPTVASAQARLWTEQLGGGDLDIGLSVSADGLGNVYTSGWTEGSLGGPNAGDRDAFISKYDDVGSLQWTRQLSTSGTDTSTSVSADGLGNIYISGWTAGNLGGENAGFDDAFISKYDDVGTLQWTQQLGGNSFDRASGVSADGLGNVYISGMTGGSLGGENAGLADAFISKYDDAGALQWTQQLGSDDSEGATGVSADGLGNVYISGSTGGNLGGENAGSQDVFVSKYDDAGILEWTRQIGTDNSDRGNGVSADGLGNVYIAGQAASSLGGANASDAPAFVTKYDGNGTLQWTRQFGTSPDNATSVSTDGLGNVFVSGVTRGSLGGANVGREDAFVRKYDANGTVIWTEQFGTSASDVANGISADGLGNAYVTGYTAGSLAGDFAGETDVFVAKFGPGAPRPEPVEMELVPRGSVWSYLDDGSNLGIVWRNPEFDDSTWQAGPAQLGYGDGDEATVVSFGGNANNKHVTTFFRHTFEVDDFSAALEMTLELLRDDGATVYLNGVEIRRDNLTSNASFLTLANGTVSSDDEDTFFSSTIDPALLREGVNVLAVEVHQVFRNSDDLSFDLSLTALVIPVPIPEPATLWMLVTGWGTLLCRRRRRSE